MKVNNCVTDSIPRINWLNITNFQLNLVNISARFWRPTECSNIHKNTCKLEYIMTAIMYIHDIGLRWSTACICEVLLGCQERAQPWTAAVIPGTALITLHPIYLLGFTNSAFAPHETGVVNLIARRQIECKTCTSRVRDSICTSYA